MEFSIEVVENDDCVLKVQRIWRIPKGHKSNSSLGEEKLLVQLLLLDLTRGPPPVFVCLWCSMRWSLFFSPFNPSEQVNDKTTKIQEFYQKYLWNGWVVLVSLLYLSGLSRKLEFLTQRKIQSEENRSIFKICQITGRWRFFRFYRFWPISLSKHALIYWTEARCFYSFLI